MSMPVPHIGKEEIHCPVCTFGGSVATDDKGARVWHPGRFYPCRVPAALVEHIVAEWSRIQEKVTA